MNYNINLKYLNLKDLKFIRYISLFIASKD